MSSTNYAGFWLRFVAYIIDYIIVYTVQSFVLLPIFAALGFGFATTPGLFDDSMSTEEAIGLFAALASIASVTFLITLTIQVLYYSFMESSKYQATVGKIALGLKVTDMEGNKLDFGKALLRNLGKIVSSMILGIGYIMAGFTEKKQGLHDMIASTLVVKK
ncbi:RDD family protein [Imperialibacter roseus]|uniref:RDD family protein n=1 Tax=Imperialibacter roseus TaxID=1324217 RepID=A0ABZ0IRZ1_9BACT|nr:RDD family protein [Imperialibacter roseus]WOK06486.1 RDD family protein [Imperialibacter roseus]|tara:strand:- start:151915 stop:152397 length:483 start_codon:yes stop_codon:yes gene_type:complete